MYVRHFLKMLFWLVVMAGVGIGGLVLANYYSKTPTTTTTATGCCAMGK